MCEVLKPSLPRRLAQHHHWDFHDVRDRVQISLWCSDVPLRLTNFPASPWVGCSGCPALRLGVALGLARLSSIQKFINNKRTTEGNTSGYQNAVLCAPFPLGRL